VRWCFFSPGYRTIDVLGGDTRTTGGAEAQIAYLAAALAQLGEEVGLIYGDGRGREHRHAVAGVTCIDSAPSWRHPASLAAFWRALHVLSPDVLYAQLPSDFLWMMGLLARRRPGARFLYQLANDVHCDPWTAYDYKRWFHAPLYALGLHMAEAITAQHDYQRTLLSPRLRKRVATVVPNLVRSISEYSREYEATTFDAIFIALIRPQKQLGVFLDLAEAFPDLRFAVVGGFAPEVSADLRASLETRLAGLSNVTFLGPRRAEEVVTLLEKTKVLVNTSLFEGFPNTMLEAWSVGVPVVSLSVDPGGVIEREQLGIVSGTTAHLQRDLATLARTASLNQRLGGNGLAYVRHRHSLQAVCKALSLALPGAQLAPAADQLQEAR
jgi:glycosyltransferase involved in cell wall biosynthesis